MLRRYTLFICSQVVLMMALSARLNAQNYQREIDSLEKLIQSGHQADLLLSDQAALSLLYYRSRNYEKAEDLYQKTLDEALKSKAQKALGLLYHNRGIMFFYQYNLDSAEFYFARSEIIRKAISDEADLIKTYSNHATIRFMKSDFKTSLELFTAGLELESKLGIPEGTNIDLINMGMAYRYMKQLDKALFVYRKASNLKNLSPKKRYGIYSGMFATFREAGKADSGLYYANKAHELAKTIGDSIDLAYSYSNLGLCYNDKKDYTTSKSYFRQSLLLSQLTDDKRLQVTNNGNLAAIYILQNLTDSADVYIAEMVRLQNELNIKLDSEDILKLLAEYYFRKKDYAKSYEYFKSYSNYRDSIFKIESAHKLLELQEKYESDKKDRENKLLSLEKENALSARNYLMLILIISALGLVLLGISYRRIVASGKLLKEQKDLLSEQQKEILDSIHYARRIQFALLTSDSLLKKHLPDHFILFKPKAVVSGDFYWAVPTSKGVIYVTGDCTGHGVPGAFMSLLFITKLNEAISEFKIERPDLLLNKVREEIVNALNQEGSMEESKDGMDAVVCHLDTKRLNLEYAAANNSFYIVRGGQILYCKSDKMPVGKGFGELQPFSFNQIKLEKGDLVYTLTDGFADQFGGSSGKKFKYKQFEELLLSIHQLPMQKQKEELEKAFENWKGKLEQVDDVCVIGVKIS